MFAKNASMELIVMMEPYEKRLHDECGLSYEEIEEIEIKAYKAAQIITSRSGAAKLRRIGYKYDRRKFQEISCKQNKRKT